MGTRSIIGQANDSGFEGRYCHWDGYPTTRGAQLLDTYRQLDGDWAQVLAYATKPGTEGYWSSFMPPAEAEANAALPDKVECWLCHGTGKRTDMKVADGCNGCGGTGQGRNRDKTDGYRRDNGDGWGNNTDDMGAEWAYLLDAQGINVVEPTYPDGYEAGAVWVHIARVPWNITVKAASKLLKRIEAADGTPVEVAA